jgi:uncharacterized protein YlzI (FlbEa/FlbD family)
MIRLIRVDGVEILLNTDHIQRVELGENRGALITLSNGEKLKVKNPVYDITQKTKAYQKGIKEERMEHDKKLPETTAEKEKPEKERKPRRTKSSSPTQTPSRGAPR